MIIGAFVAILNQTLLATALPMIMDDLHITAKNRAMVDDGFLADKWDYDSDYSTFN